MFLGLSSFILSFSDHDWINSVSVERGINDGWRELRQWIARMLACKPGALFAGVFPSTEQHTWSLFGLSKTKNWPRYTLRICRMCLYSHPTPRYGDLGFKSIVWTLQLEEENQSEEADLEVSLQPINLLRNMQYMWSDLVWQFSPNKCNPDI